MRLRWKHELVLGVELLQNVVLQGAAQLLPVHALILRVGEEERHDDDRRRVDRHGHGHLRQVDAREKIAHVVERGHGDAESAHLAQRARIVAVESHERRQIEGGAKAGLPLVEQELEALVGLPRRAEAGELAHGPQPTAVHAGVDAARVRILAGIAEIGIGIEAVEGFGGIQRIDGYAANRGRRLRTQRHRGVFLLPAFLGGGVGDGGHDDHSLGKIEKVNPSTIGVRSRLLGGRRLPQPLNEGGMFFTPNS